MSNENSNDEWLGVDKVADELKLKPVTVKRYAREGKFKSIQAKL
jgi:hypothetical protein